MKAAGFGAIFCNIRDFSPPEWETVRERAATAGVVCGPWARTIDADGNWDPEQLNLILDVAYAWDDSPYIVNSEKELNDSGSELTSHIQRVCGADDWALSMEPWPFASVDWTPIKAPVLPQIFGPQWGTDCADAVWEWHHRGVRCVVPTFGAYNGAPGDYDLLSPYGLYTADDCGNQFSPWSATGQHDPCVEQPTNGGDVATPIGNQDGIKAACNRLRDLDPSGTLLQKAGGSWPDISTLQQIPVSSWKAYDKLQRTLQILKEDHDA